MFVDSELHARLCQPIHERLIDCMGQAINLIT